MVEDLQSIKSNQINFIVLYTKFVLGSEWVKTAFTMTHNAQYTNDNNMVFPKTYKYT